MVNLVLVSHSYTLACGVAELAEQMNQGCQIAIAAGMSEPENAIGTDAMKILQGIEEVYSEEGVLVLMDLGSAILSAETALDFLDPEMAKNVKLCPAPLVEGALSAVVSASQGNNLAQVAEDAKTALNAKFSQFGEESAITTSTAQGAIILPENTQSFAWTIQNPHGLHARPAAKLVDTLSPFTSQVWLKRGNEIADARRYNQLIQLQVRFGQSVEFHVLGEDATATLQALNDLAQGHFGEEVESQSQGTLITQGKAVIAEESKGYAVHFTQQTLTFDATSSDSVEENKRSILSAILQTQQQFQQLSALPALNSTFRTLFQAHQLLLDDEELQEDIFQRLGTQSASQACWEALEAVIAQYQQLDDLYLQARQLDIADIRHRLLHNLHNQSLPLPTLHSEAILCADELYPSTLAMLLDTPFQGICLQQGSALSHTALLAKSAHIPLMIQCGEKLREVSHLDPISVNWQKGEIWKNA
ncbi:hypothetical protein A4G19_02145 [Pasteurellaceae bacterium Macca]|nr:hypothetical protein [Pasteurellaceae bacterium Macca]